MLVIVLTATAVILGPQLSGDHHASGRASAAQIESPGIADSLLEGQQVTASESKEQTTDEKTDAADDKDDKDVPSYTADTIPAVEGLTRIGESSDSIVLKWDDIPGVAGYRVYRRDIDKDESYMLFSSVSSNELRIRNLNPGSMYGFKVAAFITRGGTHEGEAAEARFATIPTEVTGFKLGKQTKDTTAIKWDKNESCDGYILERCFNGEWSEHQVFDKETTEFTDESLKSGRAYYYRLFAYREDSVGKLCGKTNDVYTVAGLLGPKDNGSESKLGRVSLDYKKSAYADGYLIYYSKDKKDWKKLKDTSRTHFSTSRLKNGVTYYFRIYAYREVSGRKIKGGYTQMEFVAKKQIYDKEVPDTYVEVSLEDQHMWYIVDGDVYLESDCVTGNYGSMDTPSGFFAVNGKCSPCTLKGDNYVSYVDYWMPFIGGGWGLHDATWRSSFGGDIYKGGGSHGCVNHPYDIAKKMYAHIEEGTPVIVY